MDYIKLIELVDGQSQTMFEQVEIQTGVCSINGDGNWEISITLKNMGTASATHTNVYVNDVEVSDYGANAPVAGVNTITTSLVTATPTYKASGETSTLTIWVGSNYATLSSGTTVNIKIHSAGGRDYIKLIELV
jgi:D-aminopeptidase